MYKGKQMKKKVTCRYGVEYTVDPKGTEGEIERFCDLMSRCCCWVCHNRECKQPRNEVIKDCQNVCDLFTKTPYCEISGILTDRDSEDYVSLEIAKLLKECGFHFPIYVFIGEDGKKRFSDRRDDWNNIEWDDGKTYSCPTMQMAMKWLRIIHKIDISITPDRNDCYAAIVFVDKELPFTSVGSFQTYEEACEKSVEFCLTNLVKKI